MLFLPAVHPLRNHLLPPDPEAYRSASHPRGRIIVVAPTRAACETIDLALQAHIDTVLEREHGEELRSWARDGKGFGIVAGTGTGKTLGIRPIAEAILGESLRVGVVNREREATPETPTWNVVIVTTGIARRWFQDALITSRDTVVVDEIHQTSAELELVLALGKRAGCRFIWLSATVDPAFYRHYLDSAEVLQTFAFDPELEAAITVVPQRPADFLDHRYIRRVIKEKRGVAVFVPTRAEVEDLAETLGAQWPGLTTAFYHGGEPIRVIRPFLEGEVERPWLLTMTAAGQSALNVRGLNTVVIYDARYGNVVDRGRNVLHRTYLGANEILQMAGRVHGRVADGEVDILTNRDLDFASLRPGPPEFQLAGDTERVAITCAALGVDAAELELPVPLDRIAYGRSRDVLRRRGLVLDGRLTAYGREVEALPVDRTWGELLVKADRDLVPVLAVTANIDSLHRMTRDERDLHGLEASGSDHLTAYNIYAAALNKFGYLGEVYGLPRHLFHEELQEWAEVRGVLVKALEDAALGMASVFRSLELALPERLPYASKDLRKRFADLVAEVMPFDLVIDGTTADGESARVSRSSMAGTWGAVAGSIRYFADRFGVPRAAIEGTTLPFDLVRRHAVRESPQIEVRGLRRRVGLVVSTKVTYHGFVLDNEVQVLKGAIPDELRETAVSGLADALFAGTTPHRDQERVRRGLDALSELYRRAGGTLDQAAPAALKAAIESQLSGVTGWDEFLETRLSLDPAEIVPEATRLPLEALPASVHLFGDSAALDYDLEGGTPVVRLRLREGQARRLTPKDVPELDRPLRFTVVRGRQPAVRAQTLEELKQLLRNLPAAGRQPGKRFPHRRRRRR
jgi:hypothetical protein